MALDEPVFVVVILELLEGCLQFLYGVECRDPEEIFLECPDEALGTAIALGRSDKGR